MLFILLLLKQQKKLCERSEGIPRWFDRVANYVLLKAAELKAEKFTPKVFKEGLEYVRQELREHSELSPEDFYMLDLQHFSN